ncbi:MAG: hypothetical protein U0359_25860 [Byssovorax sp.]
MFLLTLAAAGMTGCGPKHMQLDPRNVVNVMVRPASKQMLYCPGDPFQVEVLAKLKDGSSCSSTDPKVVCLGKENAIIEPKDVHVTGSSGQQIDKREKWVWMPDPNPLETADTGMALKAWIETDIEKQHLKTMEADANLKPTYQCMNETMFHAGSASTGQNGRDGVALKVAVTTFSTPFYPDAALIRVEGDGIRRYLISESADQVIRIISKGENGGPGMPGTPGRRGQDGQASSATCGTGGNGSDGGDGGAAGPGGNGGRGGPIKVTFDSAALDKLRQRVIFASPGGDAGPGGIGGPGGQGGSGGAGGPSGPNCSGTRGNNGRAGRNGADGAPGAHGQDGPDPVVTKAARSALFGTEMSMIQKIESTRGKK